MQLFLCLQNVMLQDAFQQVYRGRFAPSPSGNLHFGSLVTALASFILARKASGQWLLRIDDIDTPRVKPKASTAIRKTLESHGLLWDEDVLFQSEHLARYQQTLEQLQAKQLCYFCDCTRKAIKARATQYDGYCRDRALSESGCAVRLKNPAKSLCLMDVRLGEVAVPDSVVNEDFVLKRRDGIFGYHLVAVMDDLYQNINHVVRGADLLLPSACQLVLYDLFEQPPPVSLHIPVAVSGPGKKLSKQNHSPSLDNTRASENVFQGLHYLGARPPTALQGAPCEEILSWAITHWEVNDLPKDGEKKVAEHWC